MGREERRKKAREEKKENDKKVEALRWFNALPPAKAELVKNYTRIIAEKHSRHFTDALERSYSAAIINCFDYLDWHHVKKVIDVFNELVEDDVKKMKELSESYGGNLDMAVKRVNAQEGQVRDRIIELVNEGKKQKEIISILAAEFPTLSKSMITNAYKKTKTMASEAKEMKAGIEKAIKIKEVVQKLGEPDFETEEVIEYLFEEPKDEKVVEVETVEVPKLEVAPDKQEAEFEIIKEVRILDIKGKFNNYHIEKNVLEVKNLNLAFESEKEVVDWATSERTEITAEIERLQSLINLITDREKEIKKVIKKFM